jgi:hypothetical protein
MSRKKKTHASDAAKAILPTANPIKAGNRSKLAMKRAGLENIKQSFKLYDIEERFADVYVAVGFASSIAAKPFTPRDINEFKVIGRAKLASLGVVETPDDVGDRTEVIVSLPLTQQDGLTTFYALGLKRSGLSTTRNFVELRGAAVIETLRPLVASMGGVLTVIERPAAVLSHVESPADLPEADIRAADEPKAEAPGEDTETLQSASPPAVADVAVVEARGFAENNTSLASATAQSERDGSNPGNTVDVPRNHRVLNGELNDRLQEIADDTHRAAHANQPRSVAEAIGQAINRPSIPVRRGFSPPQSDTTVRRSDP